MWATSLLTMMLVFPLLSAAPLDIAGVDDNDGLHSHDNATRRGKHFSNNEFDFSVSVDGNVGSIAHEVNIDVHGHTDDHHHHEDDTVFECNKEIRILFKSIDSNNNGIMDAKELLRVCHQNNFQVTESSAVRILTLPDKTVGFKLAKFCELLKDCPSTNRADLIYFLLELYDKVTCPHKDHLSDVLLENNWRTQNEINAMSENMQRTAVIAEVKKMTGHTTEDLQGRANAGDLGSLTAIANLAALLIKDSIERRSDVKTMVYSDLRNALILEANQQFLIEVSILHSMTDRQLLKTFCTGCKVHVGKSTSNTISATVTEGCVCPTVVKKGNWLVDGTYPEEFKVTQDGSSLQVQRTDSDIGWSMDLSFMCKRVCEADKKISGSPCTCSDDFCDVGSTCVNGVDKNTCTPVCEADKKISGSPCMCSDDFCDVGSTCVNGRDKNTCTLACASEWKISGSACMCAGARCDVGGICTGGSTCTPAAPTCSGVATTLATSPRQDMVLCKDKTQETCEKDFETLCPAGWNLCTPAQFNNRNDGWDYNWKDANAGNPHGVIYCGKYGEEGMAGHYIIKNNPVLNTDQGLNCVAWSIRPGCEAFAGPAECDGKANSALCCAPKSTCGDGKVQQEEEDCDGEDGCLNTCTWKNPRNRGLTGC